MLEGAGVAAAVWTTSHIIIHTLIFLGYIAAMILVPSSFKAVIRVSTLTFVAGAGFFLFCGITHAALSLHSPYGTVVTITDHLQAGCIIAFVLSLINDLQRAARRLEAAFAAIAARYGVDVMRVVQETIDDALRR